MTPPSRSEPAARARRFHAGIAAGLAIIVVALVATGFALHHNLRAIDGLVGRLLRVEEPASTAALEMEINALEHGLGVWKYLANGDAVHRERVQKDTDDFLRYRAEYERLASTLDERALVERLDELYGAFSRLGQLLMDTRDEHVSLLRSAAESFDEIDRILDERIQPHVDPDSETGAMRQLAATSIEADVAEVGTALGVYLADPTAMHRERIASCIEEVRGQVDAFRALDLTPDERTYAVAIERALDPTVDQIQRAVELYDVLRREQETFIALRNEIDYVLDEGIQLSARRELSATEPEAKAATDRLYVASLLALGLGALVCIAAASLLAYRSVQLRAANDELRAEIGRREQAEVVRTRLQAELMSVEEKERFRLARELHDQMGQNLSTLMLGLKDMSRMPPGGDATARGAELAQLQELTGRLIQQVHTIAWELRPPSLDDFGVQGALANYVDEWRRQHGAAIDFESSLGDARFVDAVEVALYRIAQEALTNVAKHARARSVSLTLRRRGNEIVMVIEDDGDGFALQTDGARAPERRGLGVIGMQERAALVGGTLEVESAPGRGTTLVVRIPVSTSP